MAPRSWALALAVHGCIAALLLVSSIATPKRQPEQPPVFDIVIPAVPSQPTAQPPLPQSAPEHKPHPEPQIAAPVPVSVKPVVKPAPRPVQAAVPARAETPADPAPAAAEPAPVSAPHAAASAPPQLPASAQPSIPPYAPILLDWLGRHRDYPRAARLRRQEGIPRIALTLDRAGRLLGLELQEASGHDLLDQAALDMARRAAPFPPPQLPPGSEKATFIVPVQFRLDRR